VYCCYVIVSNTRKKYPVNSIKCQHMVVNWTVRTFQQLLHFNKGANRFRNTVIYIVWFCVFMYSFGVRHKSFLKMSISLETCWMMNVRVKDILVRDSVSLLCVCTESGNTVNMNQNRSRICHLRINVINCGIILGIFNYCPVFLLRAWTSCHRKIKSYLFCHFQQLVCHCGTRFFY
jgi:hypothetical protein